MDISYSNLVRITQTEQPIRGTTNKFPYSKRTHSSKFFLVEQVNGATEFHLYYGTEYISRMMTRKEFEDWKPTLSKRELNRVYVSSDEVTYYEHKPKQFGIVRSDNSIEITTTDTDQGTRLMLNHMLWQNMSGGIFNSTRHGGTIFKTYTGDKVIPIFKGLRVYIDQDEVRIHPDCNYKVVTRSLDKTKSLEIMKPYRKKLKFAETMFKTMDSKTFFRDYFDVVVDTPNPYIDKVKTDGIYHDKLETETLCHAKDIFESNPVDAMYHYMVAFNSNWIRYRIVDYIKHGMDLFQNHVWQYEPIQYFNDAKRKFERTMKQASDVFVKHTYHAGEPYPSSIWQIDVILNDQVVRTTQGGKQ